MRKPKIDVPEVRTALDAVCAVFPDHTDKNTLLGRPRYLDQGRPACLVAMILGNLGFTPAVLRDLDRESVGLGASRHPIRKRFTPDAWALLVFLQGKNDGRSTWESARRAAFRVNAYWLKANPKFAYPGPWCTADNAID